MNTKTQNKIIYNIIMVISLFGFFSGFYIVMDGNLWGLILIIVGVYGFGHFALHDKDEKILLIGENSSLGKMWKNEEDFA